MSYSVTIPLRLWPYSITIPLRVWLRLSNVGAHYFSCMYQNTLTDKKPFRVPLESHSKLVQFNIPEGGKGILIIVPFPLCLALRSIQIKVLRTSGA